MLVVKIIEAVGSRHPNLHGRAAWAIKLLHHGDETDCTPLHSSAPRWSGYAHKLWWAGLEIETVDGRYVSDFPGLHARYVLRSQVRLVRARIEGNKADVR